MHLKFKHGGGGHLESGRSFTFPLFVTFAHFIAQNVFLSLCIKFHQNRVVISHFTAVTSINKMAAAAILKLDPRLCFCDF
jgi:hypothetical protein